MNSKASTPRIKVTAIIEALTLWASSVLVGFFNAERMAEISKAGEAETVSLQADVEAALADGRHWASFTPRIERHFSQVTGPARDRIFILSSIMGLICYNAFLVVDWIMIPEYFRLGVVMQLGITTPVTVALIFAVARGWIRSNDPAIVVLSMMLSTTLIWLWLVPGLHAGTFASALQLTILGSNVVLALPFAFALGFTSVANVAIALVVYAHPSMEAGPKLFILLMTIVASAFSLIANYRITAGLRSSFLVAIVERLRADQLSTVNTRLKSLIDLDGLTSVGNRRSFDRALSRLWSDEIRQPLALILIDIDHFKALNDTYGHLAGDACLIQVAQALADGTRRPRHLLARYGGEEFGVLLAGGDIDEAFELGEVLRRSIERLVLTPMEGAAPVSVTVSLGCAALEPGDALTASDLVAAADAALYRAKQAGRNRTLRAAARRDSSTSDIIPERRKVA